MAKKREKKQASQPKDPWIDAGTAESRVLPVSHEVEKEFEEARHRAPEPQNRWRFYRSQAGQSSVRDPNDVWDTFESGEDSMNHDALAADGDLLDEFGNAVGLHYEYNESLHVTDKVESRDHERWELDPASSEDYRKRVQQGRTSSKKKPMRKK